MNRGDWVTRVSGIVGFTKADVRAVLDAVVTVVEDELAEQGECRLYGLGKLECVQRNARHGLNHTTGQLVRIPPRVVVRLKPSKALRDLVAG